MQADRHDAARLRTLESGGAAHAMTCHHLHQAKDADTVAVVARRPVDNIGCLAGPAGHRLVQREGLDVRNDSACNARTVRPGDHGSTVDWNIVKWPRALRLHRHLLPARRIRCMLEVGALPPRQGRHHLRHLWALLLDSTMGRACREAWRGAIVDCTDDVAHHAAGDAALLPSYWLKAFDTNFLEAALR